ncbi:MAG: hypothetical protein LBQ43_04760 [Holosporales bacterium]|nr:hypothetical protein [Holosporales bacterium]
MIPISIFEKIFALCTRRVVIGQVGIIVTSRCTLKCKECSALIPYCTQPLNKTLNDILNDIDILLDVVDYIYVVQLLGGEPFLHGDLDVIIDKLSSSNKVAAINIVTNGTILPNKKVITAMQNKKIRVQISGYPKTLVKNIDGFIDILKLHNVKFNHSTSLKWRHMGDRSFKNRNNGELKELFELCTSTLCNTLIDGEYHICPISGNGMSFGVIPKNATDFVDIRSLPKMEARQSMRKFFSRKVFSACNYCDGNTIYSKIIEPAEQVITPIVE